MEQLEKEYVCEAKQKWKELTEMMPFEPEEVKLATFQGLLRPFIYWSESRQVKKPPAAEFTPWYVKYHELKPSNDRRYLSIETKIPEDRFREVLKDAKMHGYAYDPDGRGFLKVGEGATA